MRQCITLGPKDSFSDLCFQKFLSKTHTVTYVPFLHGMLEHLSSDTDVLLPLENSTDGFIQSTLDDLIRHDGTIIKTFRLPVAFGCVGNLSKAKACYVTFAALQQCQTFLKQHDHLTLHMSPSNSEAYRQQTENSVAIVPMHMVQPNDVHQAFIQDDAFNQTRFALISYQEPSHVGTSMALVITPFEDRPGLLYELLEVFWHNQLNLSAIMSRPTGQVKARYHFFLEIDLPQSFGDDDLKALSDRIGKHFSLKYLGRY